MSIFLIADLIDDSDGRYEPTERVDPEYGYFTSKEEAQAYVDEIMCEPKARHQRRVEEYDAEVEKYEAEAAALRQLGGVPRRSYPSRPYYLGPNLTVVEVQPATQTEGAPA